MRISGRVDKSRNGRLRRAWLDCQPGQKERKREGKKERKKEKKRKRTARFGGLSRPVPSIGHQKVFASIWWIEPKWRRICFFFALFFLVGWFVVFLLQFFFLFRWLPFFFLKRRISKSPTIKTNEIPKKNSGAIEHFEGMNGEKKTKKESENDERLQ